MTAARCACASFRPAGATRAASSTQHAAPMSDDPCSGSGGMLILAREYVEEHGGDPRNLALYGQEYNGGTWAISKMMGVLGYSSSFRRLRRAPKGRNPSPNWARTACSTA
jgi:hypothetical protein